LQPRLTGLGILQLANCLFASVDLGLRLCPKLAGGSSQSISEQDKQHSGDGDKDACDSDHGHANRIASWRYVSDGVNDEQREDGS
jgi:hypothetical protein